MKAKKSLKLAETMIDVFNVHDWERWASSFTENSIFKHSAFSEQQKGITAHKPGEPGTFVDQNEYYRDSRPSF